MASNRPKTRNQFKQYILRKLGVPFHKVELTEEHLDDCVNDALRFYGENVYDGQVLKYYNLDTSSKAREYNLTELLPNTIVFAIEEVIDTSGFAGLYPTPFGMTQADIDFLFSLGRLEGNNLVDFELQLERISAVRKIVSEKTNWSYNFNTGVLSLDGGVPVTNKLGLILDVMVDFDGKSTGNLWSNKILIEYTTALCKMQWGTNLKKFSGFNIPGGGELNAKEIYDEGVQEKEKVEEYLNENEFDPSIFTIHMG